MRFVTRETVKAVAGWILVVGAVAAAGLLCGVMGAQQQVNPNNGIAWQKTSGASSPTLSCTGAETATTAGYGHPFVDTATGVYYVCTKISGTAMWQGLAPASGSTAYVPTNATTNTVINLGTYQFQINYAGVQQFLINSTGGPIFNAGATFNGPLTLNSSLQIQSGFLVQSYACIASDPLGGGVASVEYAVANATVASWIGCYSSSWPGTNFFGGYPSYNAESIYALPAAQMLPPNSVSTKPFVRFGSTSAPNTTYSGDIFNCWAGNNAHCVFTVPVAGVGSVTSSTLTTNKIPKATGAGAIGDSSLSDNGTRVSTPEPMDVAAGSTTGGFANCTVGAACDAGKLTVLNTQPIPDYLDLARQPIQNWLWPMHAGANPGDIIPAELMLIGDSLTICWNSSTNCNVGPVSSNNRWAEQLRTSLQAKYGYGGTGIMPLSFSEGGLYINLDNYSYTGTLAKDNSSLGPGDSMIDLSPGATVTFTPGHALPGGLPFDTFDLYGMTTSTSGTMTASVDGGAATALTACNSTTTNPTWCGATVSAASLTTHTVTVTNSSSTAHTFVYAMQGTAGPGGVEVSNLGYGGSTSASWGTNAAQQIGFLALSARPVSGANISLKTNDILNNITPTAYGGYLQNDITYIEALGGTYTGLPASVALMVTPVSAASGTYTDAQYVAQEMALYQANPIGIYSVQWRQGTTYVPAYFDSSHIHFNDVESLVIGATAKNFWDDTPATPNYNSPRVNTYAFQIATGPGCTITAGLNLNYCELVIPLQVPYPDTSYVVSGCQTTSPTGIAFVSSPHSLTGTTFNVYESSGVPGATGGGAVACTVTHP